MVRNVSVNEELSRFKPDNFIGRNSGIRTSDPKVFWSLNVFELVKVLWVIFQDLFGPSLIVL